MRMSYPKISMMARSIRLSNEDKNLDVGTELVIFELRRVESSW